MSQTINSRYLRGRPFLVVEAILRPAQGIRTERANWATEPNNWSVFERPSVVDNVTYPIMQRSTVIIDLHQRKVVKNRFENTVEEEVLNHYLIKYSDECAQAINIWLARRARASAAN